MIKLLILISLFLTQANAYDCSSVEPFKSDTTQNTIISVTKMYWENGTLQSKDLCTGKVLIKSYDVRGREEEAFYCLRPQQNEIVVCKTAVDGEDGKVTVVPATWVRNWNPRAVREYRFHAYVTKNNEPDYLKDIFSRTLSTKLKKQEIIIEGALKTGLNNPNDGYFVRAQFKK